MAKDRCVRKAMKFYNAANKFCSFIENETINGANMDELLNLLENVSTLWEALPEVEPDLPNLHRDHDQYISLSEFAYPAEEFGEEYWSVQSPHSSFSAVHDLLKDLSELHNDLNAGMCEYEAGMLRDAVWEWTYPLEECFINHVGGAVEVIYLLKDGPCNQ